MRLLIHYGIPLEGRHAVVVGRSPILGKPVAMMLLNANATVTICHSKTRELAAIVRSADIVVGAVDKPEFIRRTGSAMGPSWGTRDITRATWETSSLRRCWIAAPRTPRFPAAWVP